MSRPPISIVSFTTVFPRPGAPTLGIFVQSRLQEMAQLAEITVIAPVPWIEYGNQSGMFPGPMPSVRVEGVLTIRHPRWLYLPALNILNPFFLALFSAPSFVGRKADIIDAHFGQPAGVAASLLAALLGRPFAVTLRGNETSYADNPINRALLRWALRRAGCVISVSERLRQFAIGLGVSPQRAVTIPNGINPSVFYPRPRLPARATLGMKPSARHILSCGYLIPRKGHHHAVQALAGLRASGHDAELWIVGNPGAEGSVESELKQLVANLALGPAVHFVPGVSQHQLAEYMSAADVLCLASAREGWPNVVHEALACGCPVVASDVGGVPDMLPSDGYGTVVPMQPAADFPSALQLALKEAIQRNWDRAAISAWGLSRTWKSVAAEAVARLEDVVSQNNRRI